MDYFEEAKKVFNIPRPRLFMDNPKHCEECEEVEEKAQRSNPDTLTLEEAGYGWATLNGFLNDAGFLYYFPAFIRLCIDTDMDSGYLDSFFFAVTHEEQNNSRLKACTEEQRKFIHNFMVWYRDTHPELIEQWLVTEDVEKAIKLWNV
jgi:hypothetical protein